MNRRVFFERVFNGESPQPLSITAGLEPYKPTDKLSMDDALHLLRRTTFAPTNDDLQRAMTLTPAQAVAALFSGNQSPIEPSWGRVNIYTETFANDQARQTEYYRRYYEMQSWWLRLMRTSTFSILENLTLFWHNHFCSDYLKVYYPQLMFIQNDTFRKNAWGNIKTLTTSMIADPAMLIYLDNITSIKGNPNENFARELLELFTLGVNNYTEMDIVEASRALTGWRINTQMKGEFRQQLWDPGDKVFKGQKGKWNADDIVRIIFEHENCAKYFARKLYKHFVYEIPDEKIVGELAALLRQNNYELKPVLQILLSSAHFFDMQVRGAMVKSPIEFMVGLSRLFDFTAMPDDYSINRSNLLTQEILNPPTVEGWKGYHLWVNTNTYPQRQRIAEAFIDGRRNDNNMNFTVKPDVVAFAKRFPNVNDPRKFITEATQYLIAFPQGTKGSEYLLEQLLLNAPDYEWNITMNNVELRLRSFLQAVLTLPEFQLH
ncbi:MAG: DUF1800 domain-containing protein [Candidatus Kapabacteria bacterium]|nr:DUF1800 domain-containing protein [Candidatus Kapabacteria bacterium]